MVGLTNDGVLTIEDTSRNGTFVNGERVTRGRARTLVRGRGEDRYT